MTKRMVLVALLCAASTAAAQTVTYTPKYCQGGSQPDYGFDSIDCINCEISGRGQPWIVFHNPPVIRNIRSDGPAAGKLMEADTLVAIDGLAITTRAAAERYGAAATGDSLVFRVRRSSGTLNVTIAAGARCAPGTKLAWTWTTAPRYAITQNLKSLTFTRTPTKFTWNIAPMYFTRGYALDSGQVRPGWIGIAMFRMLRTTDQLRDESGYFRRWVATGDSANGVFEQLPEIAAVAPGSPADSAGITAGDTLVAVDGISVLTPDGARRFLDAPVGVALQITVRRGSQARTVSVVPKAPPGEPPAFSYFFSKRGGE